MTTILPPTQAETPAWTRSEVASLHDQIIALSGLLGRIGYYAGDEADMLTEAERLARIADLLPTAGRSWTRGGAA